MRAQIGEKKQWYELPEGDKEIVESAGSKLNKKT
jgi:hypothetical protein